MRHIVGELNQVQEQWVQQTRRWAEEAAHQNWNRVRSEMARLVKEVGETLVNQADGIS